MPRVEEFGGGGRGQTRRRTPTAPLRRATRSYGTDDYALRHPAQPRRYTTSSLGQNTPTEMFVQAYGYPNWQPNQAFWANWERLPSPGTGTPWDLIPQLQRIPPESGYGDGGGYGYGDGGGVAAPEEVSWRVGDYTVPGGNVPEWWKAFVPTDLSQSERPDVSISLMLNSLIPYMSPEDQIRAAQQLYTMWGEDFSAYSPTGVPALATPPLLPEEAARGVAGPVVENAGYFQSGQRAREAMQALEAMRGATGLSVDKAGAGYRWLESVLGAMQSAEGGRSRQQYLSMLGSLDPLMSQAQSGDLSAYSAIGQMLSQPFFSRGQVRRGSRSGNQYTFGRYNPLLSF